MLRVCKGGLKADPKKYRDPATAHHQAAEDLAGAIAGRDMKPILQKPGQTLKARMACREAYRL